MIETSDKLIYIKNFTVKKGSDKILINSISLSVKKGEILGVVGESGSGKTLTAKSIVNLIPEELTYESDIFKVFGTDYNKISDKEKRKLIGQNIGFVPQNTVYYLHPMLKIKDQIIDGYLYYSNSTKKQALERAEALLSKVGFSDPQRLLSSYPWQLSGGMRQRTNIAMAMMNNPKLLIADEPTTALDSTIQKQVIDLFKNINSELGVSILLISHDLGLVKYYCDRIIVMYAGQIVEAGNSVDLFENPRHPYTKSLIKVIPSLNIKKGERLSEIPGFVPDTGRSTEGCIFKDRCPYRFDLCETEVNEVMFDDKHYYKCNLNML